MLKKYLALFVLLFPFYVYAEKELISSPTPTYITIDWAHHELHEGDNYHFSEVTEMTSGAKAEWLIFVSADENKHPHLRYFVNAEGETKTDLIENPDTAFGVVTQLVSNHNRNSAKTNNTVIMSMTQLSTGGTFLDPKSFAAGNNSPGQGITPEEWVLDAGSRYVFRVTSGAANNIVSVLIHFYETNGAP